MAALLLAGTAMLLFLLWGRSQPGPTFASETAGLMTAPPGPRDAVRVTSGSSFQRAVASALAGETIVVTGRVRIAGEFTGFNRVVRGGTVNVVLGHDVRFVGSNRKGVPAVWIRRSAGWRIWGGTITNRGGSGLLVYSLPGPFTWTGFRVRDTANTCVGVYPVGGDIRHLTLAGTAGTALPNLALDPHAEKGTGIHAWNIADARGGLVEQSTFAADVVDQATGAGVEIKTGRIGPNVTVYARAHHLGFPLPGTSWNGNARHQVAGNVVQLWGGTPGGTLDLRYIEGADIRGRLLDTHGVDAGADLSRVTVGLARAGGPILLNPSLAGPPVSAAHGIDVHRLDRKLTGT